MKNFFKIYTIALVGIAAMSMAACSEPNDGDGKIAVNPSELSFDAAGGEKEVTITGDKWTATPDAGWITVEKGEGKITVKVAANASVDTRSGEITVENADDSKTVSVTQAAASADLTVAPESLDFSAAGGDQVVTVTSELEWEATSEEAWIVIDEGDGNFTVTVGVNTSLDKLTGSIKVSNGETEKIVAVEQSGRDLDPTLEVDLDELSFVAGGETKTVTVTSEMTWDATTGTAWLTIGKGDGIVTVTASPNVAFESRTGSVTVDNGEQTKTISVTQEAAEQLFVDQLVGVWASTGNGVVTSPKSGVLPDPYDVTIEKVDNTTVKISNMLNMAAIYAGSAITPTAAQDTFIATVDNDNRTISMAAQTITPSIDANGWTTQLCRLISKTYNESWGTGFVNIPVSNDMTINWSENAVEAVIIGGVPLLGSFLVLRRNPDNTITNYMFYYGNTVWTKR